MKLIASIESMKLTKTSQESQIKSCVHKVVFIFSFSNIYIKGAEKKLSIF